MSTPPPALNPTGTLDETLGFEVTETGAESARGRFAVTQRTKQPYGLVHGGAYAALAETLASVATASAVAGDGMIAVGLSNHTSFLRPAFAADTVTGVATPRHRGSTTWVWEVECLDERERPCALVRVTIAVRERRDQPR